MPSLMGTLGGCEGAQREKVTVGEGSRPWGQVGECQCCELGQFVSLHKKQKSWCIFFFFLQKMNKSVLQGSAGLFLLQQAGHLLLPFPKAPLQIPKNARLKKLNCNNYMAMVDRRIVYCSSYCQIQNEFECKSFQKGCVQKGLYQGDTAFVVSVRESQFFQVFSLIT